MTSLIMCKCSCCDRGRQGLGDYGARVLMPVVNLSRLGIEVFCIATNFQSSVLHWQVMALVQQYAELVQQVKEHLAAAGKVTSAQTTASLPSASGISTTGSP